MAETQGTTESAPSPAPAEQPKWRWEVIRDPNQRLGLVYNTIEERVLQKVTGAYGFAELVTTTGIPRLENARPANAQRVMQEVDLAAQYLRALQQVIRMNPNQPLPINRQLAKGNTNIPVIELSELIKPTQTPPAISRRRWFPPWLR